jgi:hypothetical protein
MVGWYRNAYAWSFPPHALMLTSWIVVLGEVANFAAYAFAPAILVTPLGALSVLIGAVLGSYFLKEELGTLGKLGCAICLIGSVIIVLHAPPDKEITDVQEILNYALRPGKVVIKLLGFPLILCRLPHLLRLGCEFCYRNDLQDFANIRQEEPPNIPFNMLDSRIRVCYVSQSIWDCIEIDSWREQSVHARIYLCIHHTYDGLHSDADELL